jgi:hypothetical protein
VDIGASLFLIALGAIFAFAVTVDLPGIDIQIIGWILMVVGVVGMLLSYLYWRPRRARSAGGIVHEHHYVDDPSQPPPPAP